MIDNKQLTISLHESWASILDEIIARCPNKNFSSRADVIRYCLRQEIPLLQKEFMTKMATEHEKTPGS
jgi:Arc/MetJ-type ribon-helix-helix transcriptional regulator